MGALMCELNQAYLKAINLKAIKPKGEKNLKAIKPKDDKT